MKNNIMPPLKYFEDEAKRRTWWVIYAVDADNHIGKDKIIYAVGERKAIELLWNQIGGKTIDGLFIACMGTKRSKKPPKAIHGDLY